MAALRCITALASAAAFMVMGLEESNASFIGIAAALFLIATTNFELIRKRP